jgi:peptidoglycan/xylan/chitin deacetylase (PgdA/CDA1 family)
MSDFFISLFIRLLYPGSVFRLPAEKRVVYLTFDDGPHQEITPWVLDVLKQYNAKASFFVLGKHAKRHPELCSRLLSEGHAIGNHTMNHELGWKTSDKLYLASVLEASEFINSAYFRPPYGKCTLSQFKALRKDYTFVFWDVLAEDWKSDKTGYQCFQKVIRKVRNGSVIVFHDSEKAWPRLKEALPMVLKKLNDDGFVLKALPELI